MTEGSWLPAATPQMHSGVSPPLWTQEVLRPAYSSWFKSEMSTGKLLVIRKGQYPGAGITHPEVCVSISNLIQTG